MAKRDRPSDGSSTSGASASDESTRRRRRSNKKKQGNKSKQQNTATTDSAVVDGGIANANGSSVVDQDVAVPAAPPKTNGAFAMRRDSMKAARDPRDDPSLKRKVPNGQQARQTTPVIDSDGLSRACIGTRARLDETPQEAEERLNKMRGAVRTLLECVGEDPDREGLLDTPGRYAKALMFLTKGYQSNVGEIVNNAIFNEGHNEMVIVKDIEIHSLCEHHLVPFNGKMHIGYIPNKTVIGLSKLPRIAEMYARRLQVQERLTKEVANAIMEILQPKGVAVVMEASHLCMVMRGVEQTSTSTITSCVLGCFERNSKTRNEFLSLVRVSR